MGAGNGWWSWLLPLTSKRSRSNRKKLCNKTSKRRRSSPLFIPSNVSLQLARPCSTIIQQMVRRKVMIRPLVECAKFLQRISTILLMQDMAKLLQCNGGAARVVKYGQEGSTDSLRWVFTTPSSNEQVNFIGRPGRVVVTAHVVLSSLRHAVKNHLVLVDVCDKMSTFRVRPHLTTGRV